MDIEVCVASFESLELCKKYKSDRVELCQNLSSGGLTPSPSLVRKSLDLGLETHVLIRPRPGDFCYSDSEKTQMLSDIVFYQKMGVAGIVVGALSSTRELDLSFLKQIRILTPGIELTFHKAFDDLLNWKPAMDALIGIKYNRILTAGCSSNVFKGIHTIKEMMLYANRNIQILPGGGIRLDNIQRVILELNPEAIHFSATQKEHYSNSNYFKAQELRINEDLIKNLFELSRGDKS